MTQELNDKNNYNFRTLNYLGSKLRLLDFIKEHVARVTPIGGVCDLFAGSGCVTYKLSHFFPVVCCDIQSYSKVICDALLCNIFISDEDIDQFVEKLDTKSSSLQKVFQPLIELETTAMERKDLPMLTEILEHGSVEVFRAEKPHTILSNAQDIVVQDLERNNLMNKKSVISRYYGGVYFSYLQAVHIDLIMDSIRKIQDQNRKNVFLAALLSTTSDVADTVGKHFAQPIKARDSKGKIKPLVYNKAAKDKTINILHLYKEWLHKYIALDKTPFSYKTFQGDYMECLHNLPDNIRTVYADPPYTRDHYSRFYHVLETMALDDEPEISKVKIHGSERISNGIYRKDRYQSPFCIRSKAPAAFNAMFKIVSESHRNLLLSYSPYDETKKTHPRVVTMQQLIDWAKEYFDHVETVSAGHFTHNKLNSTEHFLDSSDEAEQLIICTNDSKKEN